MKYLALAPLLLTSLMLFSASASGAEEEKSSETEKAKQAIAEEQCD